jgi:hypothetical protein
LYKLLYCILFQRAAREVYLFGAANRSKDIMAGKQGKAKEIGQKD